MIRKSLYSVILLCTAVLTLTGQVSFEAYADARQVELNGYFDITFSLKNGRGESFTPPDFNDVEVVSGPSRSVSTTIINGQVTSETNISYTLRSRKIGNLTIGPAVISVDGEVLRTKPVILQVLERKPGDATGTVEEPIFVEALTSTDSAYIGQQVSLDYKLFTTTNIESYNVLQEADYPGFYAQDLKRFESRVLRELLGSTYYTTKVLKRVALFPQQAGKLDIEPMQLQLGVVEGEGRSSGSFFFNRKIRRLMADSRPASVRVLPLPDKAPPSFSGAVGEYSMNSELANNNITTDDVLSLRVSISGTGDIKRVLPPAIDFPSSFELYEPRVVEETSFEVNGTVSSRKTFEYLAQPTETGNFTLQAVIAYFDPDSSMYKVLEGESYQLQVGEGSGRPKAALPEMAAPIARDIRYLKTPASLDKPSYTFFGSAPFWTLTALPFFLFAGMIVTQRIQQHRDSLDPALLKRRRARKQALLRLNKAKEHLGAKENRAFYDEISKSLMGYVGDKLQIPLSDMSKDNVREKLSSLQVEPSLVDRFVTLLQSCEMALFAGKHQEGARQETFDEAAELLTLIEQSLGGTAGKEA